MLNTDPCVGFVKAGSNAGPAGHMLPEGPNRCVLQTINVFRYLLAPQPLGGRPQGHLMAHRGAGLEGSSQPCARNPSAIVIVISR